MVQPVHPITEPDAPMRTVTPETLAAAYRRLLPAESRHIDPGAFAKTWLRKYEANPAECIAAAGDQRPITLALFSALRLPMPNTTEMAVFLVTNPDLEKQATEMVYVSARTPDGDNVDLIVRAISREHAEIAWRDHYDGWDLPDRPRSIATIPVHGAPGPIDWDILTPAIEDSSDYDSEAQAPSV
ncbi:hypothetical protein [Massilia orientalis]|uniref:Uncharacterized protein n=1 Tax=Massilia orientalis TaxID=3050128 RepID=A0ACC7MDM3_9BURK|nr:hypothetical protein [Massilia sp. YIM B02787]